MKTEYRNMLDAIPRLDPYTNNAVRTLTMHLRNGSVISLVDVSVEKTAVTGCKVTGALVYVPFDEICGLEIDCDEAVMEEMGVDNTFTGVVKFGGKS